MNIVTIPLADVFGRERDEADQSTSSLLVSAIKESISLFECTKSEYHVNFLRERAKIDEERNVSRTYLLLNSDVLSEVAKGLEADVNQLIVAYFTIGLSSIIYEEHEISGKSKRTLQKYFYKRDSSIGCFAIGELCRSDAYSSADVPGGIILNECMSTLSDAQSVIGGRFVLVDSRQRVFDTLYKPFGFKQLYVKNPNEVDGSIFITSYIEI